MFSLDFTSYWVHFALLRDSVRFFTFPLEVNDVGLASLVNIILHLLLYSYFKGVYCIVGLLGKKVTKYLPPVSVLPEKVTTNFFKREEYRKSNVLDIWSSGAVFIEY